MRLKPMLQLLSGTPISPHPQVFGNRASCLYSDDLILLQCNPFLNLLKEANLFDNEKIVKRITLIRDHYSI